MSCTTDAPPPPEHGEDSSRTSTWHSAFDPPVSPVSASKKFRRDKTKKKNKLKKSKASKTSKKKKRVKASTSKNNKSPPASSRRSSPSFDDDYLFAAAVVNQSTGAQHRNRSTACAKMLVQAGWRCQCHFVIVSQCPTRLFAPCDSIRDASNLGCVCVNFLSTWEQRIIPLLLH